MTDKDILEIQNVCSRPMKTLGYLPMTSKQWNNKDGYKRIEKLSVQFQTIQYSIYAVIIVMISRMNFTCQLLVKLQYVNS